MIETFIIAKYLKVNVVFKFIHFSLLSCSPSII
uniref:Uncharacterized protein n=1 Tax=Rhizophora mucronata TaxID=61149 RepID=A0A2P2QV23_RHIMU